MKEWSKQWGFLFTGKIVQNCFALEVLLELNEKTQRVRNRFLGVQVNISGEIYSSTCAIEIGENVAEHTLSVGFLP